MACGRSRLSRFLLPKDPSFAFLMDLARTTRSAPPRFDSPSPNLRVALPGLAGHGPAILHWDHRRHFVVTQGREPRTRRDPRPGARSPGTRRRRRYPSIGIRACRSANCRRTADMTPVVARTADAPATHCGPASHRLLGLRLDPAGVRALHRACKPPCSRSPASTVQLSVDEATRVRRPIDSLDYILASWIRRTWSYCGLRSPRSSIVDFSEPFDAAS